MNKLQSSKNERRSIELGVQFDDLALPLVRISEDLAVRTGMGLRICHVTETWHDRPWITAYPGELMSYDVAQVIEEQELKAARGRIGELAANVTGTPIEQAVVLGEAADGLYADAAAHGAGLIVVGAREVTNWLLPRGMTTAVQLMHHSALPVLVIPEKSEADFTKSELRVMVCDDLRDPGLDALAAAVAWSSRLRHVRLDHVHISDVRREDISTFASYMVEAISIGAIGHSQKFDEETAVARVMHAAEEKLEARLAPFLEKLQQADVKVQRRVFPGLVATTIENLHEENPYDLVVFGRHAAFHWRPLAVGQMNSSNMLQLGCPVLVAPPRRR